MEEGVLILSDMYSDQGLKARIREAIRKNALDEALNLANQLPDNTPG